jgi:hypothetical protein
MTDLDGTEHFVKGKTSIIWIIMRWSRFFFFRKDELHSMEIDNSFIGKHKQINAEEQ